MVVRLADLHFHSKMKCLRNRKCSFEIVQPSLLEDWPVTLHLSSKEESTKSHP